MQFPGAGPQPPATLYDSSFDGIDDFLALSVLYGLEGKGDTRVSAVTCSRPDFAAAQFVDVIKRFYASAAGGFGGGFGASFPVGLAAGKMESPPAFAAVFSKTGADGKPLYKSALEKYNETGDPATVLRNALSASQPHSTVIIAAGPLTSMAKMLALRGMKEMIALNALRLVIASGNFGGKEPDQHIARDVKAAQFVFAEWPTPIIACGTEVGKALQFPGASIEKDFAWSKAHPVADLYRAYQPMPYDAPTTAMDAALYAVRPSAGLFKVSNPGTFRVAANGAVEFTAGADGKHKYLSVDEAQSDNVIKALTELASAQPVARAGRGRRGNANADTPPVVVKKQ